jgi:nicotinamide-nucleotide amidase
MSYVFENEIEPYLSKYTDSVIKSLTLKMFGIGESKMEDSVKDLISGYSNPTIAPYAKTGECELRISAKASSEEEALELIKPVESEIRHRLGEYIYGINSDNLASVLIEKLKEKKITFASAESCTGGMISSMITSIAGSSDVFAGGIIAYSNEVKTGILSVNPATIEKYGAVSEECAAEMCAGCAQLFSVEASFAVTGIAGPGGGSEEKPVGTVCFGFYYKGDVKTFKMHFGGDREMVRIRSAMFVLDALRRGAEMLR